MTNTATLSFDEMIAYVDRLDGHLQAAIDDGTILEATLASRDEILAMRHSPHLREIMSHSAFLWGYASRYKKCSENQSLGREFIDTERALLKNYRNVKAARGAHNRQEAPTAAPRNAAVALAVAAVGEHHIQGAGVDNAAVDDATASMKGLHFADADKMDQETGPAPRYHSTAPFARARVSKLAVHGGLHLPRDNTVERAGPSFMATANRPAMVKVEMNPTIGAEAIHSKQEVKPKRKRGDDEDVEKKKRVRNTYPPKDTPNPTACNRCVAKSLVCYPQDVPVELEKTTTACVECAKGKQGCQFSTSVNDVVVKLKVKGKAKEVVEKRLAASKAQSTRPTPNNSALGAPASQNEPGTQLKQSLGPSSKIAPQGTAAMGQAPGVGPAILTMAQAEQQVQEMLFKAREQANEILRVARQEEEVQLERQRQAEAVAQQVAAAAMVAAAETAKQNEARFAAAWKSIGLQAFGQAATVARAAAILRTEADDLAAAAFREATERGMKVPAAAEAAAGESCCAATDSHHVRDAILKWKSFNWIPEVSENLFHERYNQWRETMAPYHGELFPTSRRQRNMSEENLPAAEMGRSAENPMVLDSPDTSPLELPFENQPESRSQCAAAARSVADNSIHGPMQYATLPSSDARPDTVDAPRPTPVIPGTATIQVSSFERAAATQPSDSHASATRLPAAINGHYRPQPSKGKGKLRAIPADLNPEIAYFLGSMQDLTTTIRQQIDVAFHTAEEEMFRQIAEQQSDHRLERELMQQQYVTMEERLTELEKRVKSQNMDILHGNLDMHERMHALDDRQTMRHDLSYTTFFRHIEGTESVIERWSGRLSRIESQLGLPVGTFEEYRVVHQEDRITPAIQEASQKAIILSEEGQAVMARMRKEIEAERAAARKSGQLPARPSIFAGMDVATPPEDNQTEHVDDADVQHAAEPAVMQECCESQSSDVEFIGDIVPSPGKPRAGAAVIARAQEHDQPVPGPSMFPGRYESPPARRHELPTGCDAHMEGAAGQISSKDRSESPLTDVEFLGDIVPSPATTKNTASEDAAADSNSGLVAASQMFARRGEDAEMKAAARQEETKERSESPLTELEFVGDIIPSPAKGKEQDVPSSDEIEFVDTAIPALEQDTDMVDGTELPSDDITSRPARCPHTAARKPPSSPRLTPASREAARLLSGAWGADPNLLAPGPPAARTRGRSRANTAEQPPRVPSTESRRGVNQTKRVATARKAL